MIYFYSPEARLIQRGDRLLFRTLPCSLKQAALLWPVQPIHTLWVLNIKVVDNMVSQHDILSDPSVNVSKIGKVTPSRGKHCIVN